MRTSRLAGVPIWSGEAGGLSESADGMCRLVDVKGRDGYWLTIIVLGYVRGLRPETDECEERCLDSLERYGQALYRMNAKGPRTTPRGCKWLRRLRVSYQDTATDCPITRGFEDGEEALSVDCKG